MKPPSAIAIAAHPDDIEFVMAGTLCRLREAGYETHYLNISTGSCGSLVMKPAQLRKVRRGEAMNAARLLGAQFHESGADDLEILYTVPLLRWLTGVIRKIQPTIVLTHSPDDYMEDHMNASRLAVTAAFARAIPNFKAARGGPISPGDVTIYHAMPVGLQDQLRRRVEAGAYVDTTSVQKTKLAALACHKSQDGWLQATQGMSSYLRSMEETSREVGRRSRRFRHAEGWRRHSHMGYCAADADPLRDALGDKYLINAAYERSLRRG